jgi:hypothetical protein
MHFFPVIADRALQATVGVNAHARRDEMRIIHPDTFVDRVHLDLAQRKCR